MKIFNSVTKQYFELDSNNVSIYNCGPTVYNHIHIGNARPLITFDVLYRFLRFKGVTVNYIHNITDIDDKIIAQSKIDSCSEKEVSEKYFNAYVSLFIDLNIKSMTMPKVSDNMGEIIKFIQKLVDLDFAYVVAGDVYFSINKLPNYGHISNRKIEDMQDGVRKTNKTNKRFPLDFTLWKQTTDGINWPSPWSSGRPGWHTECVSLINNYIGKQVDIHGGGIDLKFPHHENENAQNFALNNIDIARVWMHVGHINIDNQKMAKSAGNFVLVKDILKIYNSNVFRWFFYQTKYQNPINYSKNLFDDTSKTFGNLERLINIAITNLLLNNVHIEYKEIISKNFEKWANDDLNLANMSTEIISQIKELNKLIRNKDFNNCCLFLNYIKTELSILGIKIENKHCGSTVSMIKEYKNQIDLKEYTAADLLREQLIKKGVM